jgi:nitrogen fixation protein FixH
MMDPLNRERLFTGRHMLYIVVSFFIVVLIANMTMVYFAKRSWSGLVVANSYVASQHFNEDTKRLQAMLDLGIAPSVKYSNGVLSLTLMDAQNAPIAAHNVTVRIGRPIFEGDDRTISLVPSTLGAFSATEKLGVGVWAGRVIADVPGQPRWERAIRFIVKVD